MKSSAAACLIVASVAVLLLAGCGGGGSSSGSSTTAPMPGPGTAGGPVKKATAPQEPAGSEVVSCVGGAGGVSALRAAATGCAAARATMRRWRRDPACRLETGSSRASCSLGAYRCQAIEVDRGTAVSCARPDGGDVSFLAGRGH